MAFHKIDQDSPNTITSALDFFNIPATNTSVQSSSWREVLPLNPITDIPYHFKIHTSNNYMDLSKCYLLSEMRIKKRNPAGDAWINLEVGDLVGSINFIGSTFIKNLKIFINQKEIYDSNSLYSYRTWLDTELSLPQLAKNTYLNAAGYYEDSADPNNVLGAGFLSRRALFNLSATGQFIARIDADFFNQQNYLLSGTELDVEITPQDSDFMVLEPGNTANVYKLEITNLKLYVKMIELMDGLALDVTRKLDTTPARYAIRRTSIKSFQINEGVREFSANLWNDQVPRRIVCGLVANQAYRGAKNLSPFKFEPFNVRELTIFANARTYPSSLYNLDYAGNKFIRSFHDFHDALGTSNGIDSNGIYLDKYKTGTTLYAFMLTNSMEDSTTYDLIRSGSTSINIKFTADVPANGIVLIVFAEFDSLIFIDKNRNIVSDYNI